MKPLRGPYPRLAALDAQRWLLSLRHRPTTVTTAEMINTPLWQDAVWRHMSDQERHDAEERAAVFIEGRTR